MEGQEYLNEISAQNRPMKNDSGMFKLLKSKFFLVGAIGVGVLILILIIGGIISGSKGDVKSQASTLSLHLSATIEVINEYQDNIKSSNLRSSSASLNGILSDTNNKLTNFLTEKYNFKEKDVDKSITTEITTNKEALETELFEAKINGTLDRTYAHKMAYEIALIMTEEAQIVNSTSNSSLAEFLTSSYTSLGTLYDQFNNFSEGVK